MTIQENLAQIQAKINTAALAAGRDPTEITLVAATKTQSSQTIRDAIAAGVVVCGENRVQELTAHLQDDAYHGAALHFIGHLQTNKVKDLVGRVALIHSVSSLRLLHAIDTQAEKLGVTQDILLEVNIAQEESKEGFSVSTLSEAVQATQQLQHIRLRGLMAIPPAAVQPGDNLPYFQKMKQIFVDMKSVLRHNVSDYNILSMGMSGDFADAITAGATHIRVGTALFGPRLPQSTRKC